MGMRIFASCTVLTKACRYGSLLPAMDLRNRPERSCALLRPVLQAEPVQMNRSAVEA
jgi:hypothetical protein